MIVTLLQKDRVSTIALPEKVNGKYWVCSEADNGESRKIVSVEASNGKWVLRGNNSVILFDEQNQRAKTVIMEPQRNYHLFLRDSNADAWIYLEQEDRDLVTFRKYATRPGVWIPIGRAADNVLRFNSPYVGSHHATLSLDGNGWAIKDDGSRNGTYVNNRRVSAMRLAPGDVIFIMGLTIIIGAQYISLNNPHNSVFINPDILVPFPMPKLLRTEQETEEVITDEDRADYFDRSPRFHEALQKREFTIDAPPAPNEEDKTPLALILGPSMTMGIVALATAGVTISGIASGNASAVSSATSLLMSVSMMMSSMLWPSLSQRYQSKLRKEKEQLRQEKYSAYLEGVLQEIEDECKRQTELLHANFTTAGECAQRVINRERSLWERMPEDGDFLELRVGTGNVPMKGSIKYQEKHFSLTDDNLQERMQEIGAGPYLLRNVPVTVSFKKDRVVGVIGNREEVIPFAQGLLVQLTALHSYDEVKLVMICRESERKAWEEFRWTPHSWDAAAETRYYVTNNEDARELSTAFESMLAPDTAAGTTHYVVLIADKALFEQTESLHQLLEKPDADRFSFIALFDELNKLPKECSVVIDLNGDNSQLRRTEAENSDVITFCNEMRDALPLRAYARSIAGIQVEVADKSYDMPQMLSFLEMYNVGRIEHLNPLSRWNENDPTKTLKAPVGVDTTGGLMSLDLHEKYHGPHGLVAGMTGSGKSEFIISYILSMAVNYHPDEVAFILIDYKGGGLAGAFENEEKGIKLPHLAGTITNLDGASVNRSLISIQSELRRRQSLFNEARKVSNEGTMDIYKYQKLRRAGTVQEPVPHLFIISDEFAELKQQQPEFMEQLISAARIGRSLGVHLILATQKPSGVVDDQIWSNSKFRVCLKVQERSDSQDMIKSPDAAALSITGRFYLQVGYNEFYGLGQSAWSGAPYVAADFVNKKEDNSVEAIDRLGHGIIEAKPAVERKDSKVREIVAVVNYLSELAEAEQITVRPLWLPAMPALIYHDALVKKYGYKPGPFILDPVIGEYDDPFNQSQNLLTLSLTGEGNAIVYGYLGSGTDELISTMVYSLITMHSSDEVNLYLLDFGGETLRAFDRAPHVGDVVYANDNEKVTNLFSMLQDEIEDRRSRFSEFGGSHQAYCASGRTDTPSIVVVINNYSAFIEINDEAESEINVLTREGNRVGIYFVVTAATANAVRYKVAQNFKQNIVLQLNDKSDYSGILGNTDGVFPSDIKGRGLIRGERVYEIQTAHAFEPEREFEELRRCAALLKTPGMKCAPHIPVLPAVVDADFLQPQIGDLKAVPVAVAKESLDIVTIDCESSYISLVAGQDAGEFGPVAAGIAQVISRIPNVELHIWDIEEELTAAVEFGTYVNKDFAQPITELFGEVVTRNNTYKDAGMDRRVLDVFPEKVYMISGMRKLLASVDSDKKEKLALLLEKGEAEYRVHFLLCEPESDISTFAHEPWFTKHVSTSDGLWVGDGFGGQYTIKPSHMSGAYYQEIGSFFGYHLRKGKTTLIKPVRKDFRRR